MSFTVKQIRNVCLLGHSGSGKTTLVESMLYQTDAIARMGKTPDGNTTSDFDAEEIRRQISISASIVPIKYKDCLINVIDCPGNFDFYGEVAEALTAADAAVIVLPAKGGVPVGAERAWKLARARKLPTMFYISKVDEDNSDYNAVVAELKEKFGNQVTPIVSPLWDANKKVIGVLDVLDRCAYGMQADGKSHHIDIPADKADFVEESYAALMENVAEYSEEFMELFFDGHEFTPDEVAEGLLGGLKEGSIAPVFGGSAFTGLGTEALLHGIVSIGPYPTNTDPMTGVNADGDPIEVAVNKDGDTVAYVFKTVSDQYGKYSYVKVLRGVLRPDMTLINGTTGASEKIGRLYAMCGKKTSELKELNAGDIGAIAKMDRLKTGDTLSPGAIKLDPVPFAEPVYSKAIAPAKRGQEDKVGVGLNRLNEDDATLSARARDLRAQAEAKKAEYGEQAAIADQKSQEAGAAMEEAAALVEQMQATYDALSAEAQALYAAEQAAAYAAPTEGGYINDDGTVTDIQTGQVYASASEYTVATGNTVVDRARAMIGSNYVWGGVGGSDGGFDCSGLVSYALTGSNTRLGNTTTFMGWNQTSNPQVGDVAVNSYHTGIVSRIDSDGTVWVVHAINESQGVQETPLAPYGDYIYVTY